MAAQGTTWQVTSQQETTRPDASGQFVSGVVVGFKTDGGLHGTVFVPDDQYNGDTVKTMIQEKVDKMAAVQGLTG